MIIKIDLTYHEFFNNKIDHLVVVADVGFDIVAHECEWLVEDGEEHIDKDISNGNSVAEEEERTEEGAGQLHGEEVEPSEHHLKEHINMWVTWMCVIRIPWQRNQDKADKNLQSD